MCENEIKPDDREDPDTDQEQSKVKALPQESDKRNLGTVWKKNIPSFGFSLNGFFVKFFEFWIPGQVEDKSMSDCQWCNVNYSLAKKGIAVIKQHFQWKERLLRDQKYRDNEAGMLVLDEIQNELMNVALTHALNELMKKIADLIERVPVNFIVN